MVVHSRSALKSRKKKFLLVAEGVRRLKNCSPSLGWAHKAAHLTELSLAMFRSGHSQAFREVVLGRAIAKYKDMLLKHELEGRCMYRSKSERELMTMSKGGMSKNSNWFAPLGYK